MTANGKPLEGPTGIYVREFDDPETYVHMSAINSGRPADLVRGRFHAKVGYLRLAGINVSIGATSVPVAVTGTVPDRHVFSFGTSPGGARRVSGRDVPDGHLFHFRPNDTMFATSPSGQARPYAGIAVPYDVMAAAGPTILGADPRVPLNDNALFAAPPGTIHRLTATIADAIRVAETSPSIVFEPTVMRAMSGALVGALARCLTSGRPLAEPAPLHRRRRTVMRLIDLMRERPEDMLSMADVCQALRVPERTLNLLCQEFFGMSAMRYVRGRRMDHVRKALLTAGPSQASVTMVATQFGFWDLGRFARAYHEIYGELPSHTARRAGSLT